MPNMDHNQELGSQDSGESIDISANQQNAIVNALFYGSTEEIEQEIDSEDIQSSTPRSFGQDDPVSEALIWPGVTDPRDDTTGQFAQLVAWVDRIVPQLELTAAIPPCWWNHRIIVWELRDLWALAKAKKETSNEFIEHLHAAIRRITGTPNWAWNVGRCSMSEHVAGKQMEWVTDYSGIHTHIGQPVAKPSPVELDPVAEAARILEEEDRAKIEAEVARSFAEPFEHTEGTED
jgi:hypothetical protein